MRYVTTHEGEDLTRLIKRVFPRLSKKEATEVHARFREAHPGLSKLESIPAGTIVIIPQLPGVEVSADVRDEADIAASLLDEARRRIDDLTDDLKRLTAERSAELNDTLESVKSKSVRTAASRDEELATHLRDLTASAKEDVERIKTLDTFRKKAVAEMDDDLNDLARTLRVGPV